MKILITLFNTKLLKFQKLINCDSFKSFTKGLVLGLQFFELILLTKLFSYNALFCMNTISKP